MRHLGWFSNTLKCNGNIWNIYWNCINSKDVQRKKNAQTTLKIATIGTDFIGFKMLIRRFLGFLDRGSIGLINVPQKHFENLMHFLNFEIFGERSELKISVEKLGQKLTFLTSSLCPLIQAFIIGVFPYLSLTLKSMFLLILLFSLDFCSLRLPYWWIENPTAHLH